MNTTELSIKKGLKALAGLQTKDGEFKTYWSNNINMTCPHEVSSPFITGLVLDLLNGIDGAGNIIDNGLKYLTKIRPDSGIFRFFDKGIDADLDSISLLNLVMQTNKCNFDNMQNIASLLKSFQKSNGGFDTWIRKSISEKNENDACVEINVYRFLTYNGYNIDNGWLKQILNNWNPERDTLFYVQPYILVYFLSQLLISNNNINYIKTNRFRIIVESSGHKDLLDTAFRLIICSIINTHQDLTNSLKKIIVSQQNVLGYWPSWGAFQAFNYWGSSSLTTAVCIRSLWVSSKY